MLSVVITAVIFNITESLGASHLHDSSIFPGGLIFSPTWKVHDSFAMEHAIPAPSHILGPCGEGVLPCPVHPEEQESFMIQALLSD